MSIVRLVKLLINLVGARAGGALIGMLSQIVLTQVFAPADVGLYLLALSILIFVSMLMTCGYPALAVTYLARYQTLARRSLIAAFHAAARRDTAVMTLICAVAAVIVYNIPAFADLRPAILFGCLAAPAQSLIRLNNAAANALKRFTLSYFPDFIMRSGLYFLAIVGLYLFTKNPPIVWALVSIVVATYAVAAIQAWMLGPEGALAYRGPGLPRNLRRYLRGRAASLVIVSIVAGSFAEIVTLVSGLFLPPAEVAVVGIAVRLASIAGFVTQASLQFIMRDLTAAMAAGNSQEIERLIRRTNITNFGLMLAAIAGAAVLGDFVLGIFGNEYRAGLLALIVFLVSQLVRSASGMNAHLLSLGGYQKQTAALCVVALAVLIAAAAILARTYGATGIAIAALIADLVWAAGLAMLAARLAGRRGDLFAGFLEKA